MHSIAFVEPGVLKLFAMAIECTHGGTRLCRQTEESTDETKYIP